MLVATLPSIRTELLHSSEGWLRDATYLVASFSGLSLSNSVSRPTVEEALRWAESAREPTPTVRSQAGTKEAVGMLLVDALIFIGAVVMAGLGLSARVVKQYERGLLFRFGRIADRVRGPGLTMIVPGVDRLRKVNMQIVTMAIPAQAGITRDNVTVTVDAVVYFRVIDPVVAIVNVENYPFAVSQVAQTSLRSVIGKSDLDDLLTNREHLNQGLELMIDSPAAEWGIHIDRVEIKDVALPEAMKRSMSRQAEAERERRARVISADGELQASAKLAQAAGAMAETPGALQLRLLETIVEVAAEKNSTLVLPFPVELLRFLEHNTKVNVAGVPNSESRPPTMQSETDPNEIDSAADAKALPPNDRGVTSPTSAAYDNPAQLPERARDR
jgi:regulator of protease activity HflC (stomatin/prohibitin superfamily)